VGGRASWAPGLLLGCDCEPGKTREEKETGDDIPSFPYLLVFSISNNNNSKIAAITTLFLSFDKAVICSIEFPGGTLELSRVSSYVRSAECNEEIFRFRNLCRSTVSAGGSDR
jgi:hypothetical protein